MKSTKEMYTILPLLQINLIMSFESIVGFVGRIVELGMEYKYH